MSQRRKHIARCLPVCAAMAAAGFAMSAQASVILIESDQANSTEELGSFTGAIEYAPNPGGSSQGQLTISLVNTTPSNIGGFLTGFVFNIASEDPQASAQLSSGTHPFLGVSDHKAPPFGMSFDAGAALGGNWTGGGNPNAGVAVDDSAQFTFDVFASDADILSAESFFSGPYDHNFVVRFRGMSGGSDKVPAGGSNSLPAPGALAVLAIAGLGIGGRRRRTTPPSINHCRA